MYKPTQRKFDTLGKGLLAGLILPVVLFFCIYLTRENEVSFINYMNNMWQMQTLLKVGSLCVFANSGLFWFFLNKKYEKAARGVLAATILYAFVVIISKAI